MGQRTDQLVIKMVRRNSVDDMHRLLRRRGRSLLNVTDVDGCTPLLLACKLGNFEFAKFLVQEGACVAETDHDFKVCENTYTHVQL